MTFSIANDEFFDIGKPDFLNFFDLSLINKTYFKNRISYIIVYKKYNLTNKYNV